MAHAAAVAEKTRPHGPPRRRTATPRRLPYLLIAPAALLMLGFIAYPVISVFYYSLQNYNVIATASPSARRAFAPAGKDEGTAARHG